MSSHSDDQRGGRRAPLRLRVDYQRMNSFFADYTKNLSKGGTFIKTSRPLAIGSHCHFTLTVPALSDPITLEGEVAWVLLPEVAKARGEEAGMGVKFVFAGDAARRQFEALVERMMEESLGAEVAQGLLQRR